MGTLETMKNDGNNASPRKSLRKKGYTWIPIPLSILLVLTLFVRPGVRGGRANMKLCTNLLEKMCRA